MPSAGDWIRDNVVFDDKGDGLLASLWLLNFYLRNLKFLI